MTLNYSNRFVWLVIGAMSLFMLQSGCQPVQQPTPAATALADAEGSRANLSTNIMTETPSPDGEWIATTIFQVPRAGDTYYQNLTVTHADGVPSYAVVDREAPFGLGYTVAEPLMWSDDGERFYYTNRPQADGCGLLFNGSDLSMLDLATGETTELLPADTTTTLGLAPDEEEIAYLAIGEPALILRKLTSGNSTTFDLAPLLAQNVNEARPQVGAFVWSPDSRALAFVVAHNPCIGGWAESTSIYVLDTESMTTTSVLAQDDRNLAPVAWPDDATLLVENQLPFDRIDEKQQYFLDLATTAVTTVAE
jgi:Tol biopolymer transport system component